MSHRVERDGPPPLATGHRSPARTVRTPRWGHIYRSTGRYGGVTTHLVVYPPEASDDERLWADASRILTPFGVGGAVIAAILTLGIGTPPELALPSIASLLLIGWVVLSSKTTRIRRHSASAWASTSAISPDRHHSSAETPLTHLADTMADAARAYRDGTVSANEYDKTWRDVFDDVARLSENRGT